MRIEQFEDSQERTEDRDKYDDSLHRSFRPGDREGELSQQESAAGNPYKMDGDIGQGVATRVASEKLDLTPDPRFDQPYHGLDGVYRDQDGQMVLVEAKLDKRGINALRENQMQPDWVERRAKLMQMEGSKQYTPGNAEIGAEIEKQGPDSIRRVVIVTHPGTLEVTAHEGQADNSWKKIGTWSAFEFEQPTLEEDNVSS